MVSAAYLLSIEAVRERCSRVFEKVKSNSLSNFDVDLEKLDPLVASLKKSIGEEYPSYAAIPPHGRWQHFEVGDVPRITDLVDSWKNNNIPEVEIARRLVDLFVVSVLLDAGAGNAWKYLEKETGQTVSRSEGLAVASIRMFINGDFSSVKALPYQVDSAGLSKLTEAVLRKGMQVTEANPLAGVEGRAKLLRNLGDALETKPKYFGDAGRPGHFVDYLLSHKSTTNKSVPLPVLWNALMDGLQTVWPQGRTKFEGVPIGDAWACSSLPDSGEPGSNIVPFHKLTQWLCYSLLRPIEQFGGVTVLDKELQTGLPEYRNGGLLVDYGVLTLKPHAKAAGLAEAAAKSSPTPQIPLFPVDSDVVVEWRAATVGLIDEILLRINHLSETPMSLPQLLEAGTWKAGRKIAATKRPQTKGPPIDIISDGTVF